MIKKILILSALLASLWSGILGATNDSQSFTAYIAPVTTDTSGVLLAIPNSQQTVLVKKIIIFYDNGAAASIFYVGICTADQAHTRQLWFGHTMAGSGISTAIFDNLNKRITPATAQAGVRLFCNAASSDTLEALVEYELIPQ